MATHISLVNQVLIAMPTLSDFNFRKSVIYLCEHHTEGTVGLMINRPMQYPLGLVFDQLNIHPLRQEQKELPLLFGGPLQPERGFVIHRPSGGWRSSLPLREDVTVTTSSDIIRAIAQDTGPKDALVTLGYVGWSDHQLDKEVLDNFWLICPYKPELLYEIPFEKRWEYAGSLLGVDMNRLVSSVGHG
jgi:putative transcriptional regulator